MRRRQRRAGIRRGDFWNVLGYNCTHHDGTPYTLFLTAQVGPGDEPYRLEVQGKDKGALDLIRANIPSLDSMDKECKAFKFTYGRIDFCWAYWSKFSSTLSNH